MLSSFFSSGLRIYKIELKDYTMDFWAIVDEGEYENLQNRIERDTAHAGDIYSAVRQNLQNRIERLFSPTRFRIFFNMY